MGKVKEMLMDKTEIFGMPEENMTDTIYIDGVEYRRVESVERIAELEDMLSQVAQEYVRPRIGGYVTRHGGVPNEANHWWDKINKVLKGNLGFTTNPYSHRRPK